MPASIWLSFGLHTFDENSWRYEIVWLIDWFIKQLENLMKQVDFRSCWRKSRWRRLQWWWRWWRWWWWWWGRCWWNESGLTPDVRDISVLPNLLTWPHKKSTDTLHIKIHLTPCHEGNSQWWGWTLQNIEMEKWGWCSTYATIFIRTAEIFTSSGWKWQMQVYSKQLIFSVEWETGH